MQTSNYAAISLLLLGLTLASCSKTTHDKFVPSIDSARDALELALEAWRDGQPPKAIDVAEVLVQPIESRWQQGKKLLEFEILKELDVEGPKQFLVRIKLAGSAAPEEATYIVLGKDPLYVYYLTDYEQSSKTM